MEVETRIRLHIGRETAFAHPAVRGNIHKLGEQLKTEGWGLPTMAQ